MIEPSATCWTLIQAAAAGSPADQERFARRYGSVVRAYLGARWKGAHWVSEMDDALQEVFLECFRDGGALQKVESRRDGGFRAFLYGITRNVASRFEVRRGRRREVDHGGEVPEVPEEDLERVFDRAWARSVVRQALQQQSLHAQGEGALAVRRVDLLRLRFQEGLPIRDIATRWKEDAAKLHKEYARARQEFLRALREVVSFHLPNDPNGVDAECRALIELLK